MMMMMMKSGPMRCIAVPNQTLNDSMM